MQVIRKTPERNTQVTSVLEKEYVYVTVGFRFILDHFTEYHSLHGYHLVLLCFQEGAVAFLCVSCPLLLG